VCPVVVLPPLSILKPSVPITPTVVGVFLLVVVPSPIEPPLLYPQHLNELSFSFAHEVRPPLATSMAVLMFEAVTRETESVLEPFPREP
jgi:hypothetical protein